jgi:heterodisulfide reductase subunit C
MSKFGYTISLPRIIDYDNNDRSVADYILERENSFRMCIECGGCSATCTTGKFTSFSLRELNILIKRGENEKPADKIKHCMLCGKCMLVCPRGVNTRNIVFLAKQAYTKSEGYEV